MVASASGRELRALCSAAKDLVSAGKSQEGILITYPTPNELAASMEQQSFGVVNCLVQLQDRVRIIRTLERQWLALRKLPVLRKGHLIFASAALSALLQFYQTKLNLSYFRIFSIDFSGSDLKASAQRKYDFTSNFCRGRSRVYR
jgi:hypothetical protein